MRLLAVTITFATFAACASTPVPMPTPQQGEAASQRWPGTTLEDLKAGRTLYVERCSGCHSLPVPDAYAADAWPKVIDEMAARAHLAGDDRTRVLRYLVTVSPSAKIAGK
jgi:cytochrome c5